MFVLHVNGKIKSDYKTIQKEMLIEPHYFNLMIMNYKNV
jgi:hypothetical protein